MNRHVRAALAFSVSLLLLPGCDSEESAVVRFEVVHHASPDGSGAIPPHSESDHRTFRNDAGFEVTLTQAYLVISAVELVPLYASQADSRVPGWLEWLAPAAAAHGGASSQRLEASNVVDLLVADLTPRPLGGLEPPHGDYLGMRVLLGPADVSTAYLPSDFNMTGHTLRLVGRMVQAPDTLGFGYVFDLSDSVDVEFPAASGGPINFTHGTETSLGIGIVYDTWFQGVDPRSMSPAQREARILANVMASIGYHSGASGHDHAPAVGNSTAP